MRISAKGRYALAAAIKVADKEGAAKGVTVGCIASELGISKIYLEQVFGQLKKSGLLAATKGPKGGYSFARPPASITVWDILSIFETSLADKTEETVKNADPGVEIALTEKVYEPLGKAIKKTLSETTLQNLHDYALSQRAEQSFMMGL